MQGRVVWINGKFVPEAEARISIYDSALMFGDMVFEMTRSFQKKHFKLEQHIDRLLASARWIHIPMTMSKENLIEAVMATEQENDHAFLPDDEHRMMINVTRGILGIYQGVVGTKPGTKVIIADFPLRWTVKGMGSLFDTGINAVIPSQRSIPALFLDPKVKSRSRMHLMLANIQASRIKGENNWPLLLDTSGFISEGTGDNFFIVRGHTIITPKPRDVLRGISRGYIFDLSNGLPYTVVEDDIEPFDVLEADEAFMTGTPFCMLPVVSLDGVKIGIGTPGPVFNALLREWGLYVGVDIKEQIQKWNCEDKEKAVMGSTPYQFEEE